MIADENLFYGPVENCEYYIHLKKHSQKSTTPKIRALKIKTQNERTLKIRREKANQKV